MILYNTIIIFHVSGSKGVRGTFYLSDSNASYKNSQDKQTLIKLKRKFNFSES